MKRPLPLPPLRKRPLAALSIFFVLALLQACQAKAPPVETTVEGKAAAPETQMTIVETTTPKPAVEESPAAPETAEDAAEAPALPAAENIAAQYAPTPNFQMTFELRGEDGIVESVEYNSVALRDMPAGYLSTVYRVDKPSEFTHYFFDADGLRTVNDLNFEDSKLALPVTMETGSAWDANQLIRVEVDGDYSLGATVDSAFVLVMGEESDECKVYSMGMGLVGLWHDASPDGPATSRLTEMIKIDEATAQSGFRSGS